MPPPASESDNYKLLFAIVEQMEVKNINWKKVADSLGIEKVNTVQKRWSVLKKNTGLGQPKGAAPTPAATPSPKKRTIEDVNANGGSGRAEKKIKAEKVEIISERSDGGDDDEI